MTALVQAVSRHRATRTVTETDIFKIVALFCGAGLAMSLICATYGLDVSPGFF
jgi:hypothetical protein